MTLSRLLWSTLVVAALCLGCDRDEPRPIVVEPRSASVAAAPTPAVEPGPLPVSTDCGSSVFSAAYPVTVHLRAPSEIQPEAPLTYTITVSNGGTGPVQAVQVSQAMPKGFSYVRADPAAKVEGGTLTWMIPTLVAGAAKDITVVGRAGQTGCLEHCVHVAWAVSGCANTKVVEPKLVLTRLCPDQTLLCDPVTIRYAIANTGTGAATDVRVAETLPAGLTTQDGFSNIALSAGDLPPGGSRRFEVVVRASKAGTYSSKAAATVAGAVKAESVAQRLAVTQPVLELAKSGSEKAYIGSPVTYRLRVTNKGDGIARDVVVEDVLPPQAGSIQPSSGGQVAGSKVVWKLDALAPGQSRDMSLSCVPTAAGAVTNAATATAYCAQGVKATATTTVTGIAAILLEVIDVEDPIPVGEDVTYVITATNQGSQTGTNIAMLCTLEDSQRYVSSSGATAGLLIGNRVRFAPLPALAPKAEATWTVKVRAVKAGDVRFMVEMNTDQLGRPVVETEATHQYE